ncbi:MAG TPA: aminofutalosine synthase MqnE [Geobacterales bacterium]|nr:aminofutalosine synthase MqnE [Geobacterales bacterium]
MNEFDVIADKVHGGKRLSEADALVLFHHPDPLAVGALAAQANERRHGRRVFFNVNRHINYTNLCVNRCRFCAFSREPGEAGAYTHTLEEMAQRAREAAEQGATEIHIVGGLHPELPFDFYLQMLRTVQGVSPRLHLKAFTAVEIDYLAGLAGLSLADTLAQLKDAGLGSLPGGGAEILVESVRKKLCPEKISGARWLKVMEEVHRSGLKSNATMLYGHLESIGDRIRHMALLRELQDRTKGFQAFIPLPFQQENTPLTIEQCRPCGGMDDLRTLAVARLFLDNFDHIKAYWVMLGVKIAQVALAFGVNDLDGTVVEERIGHDAGADSPQQMSRDDIVLLIRNAGREPVERDTLYNVVRAH